MHHYYEYIYINTATKPSQWVNGFNDQLEFSKPPNLDLFIEEKRFTLIYDNVDNIENSEEEEAAASD